MVRLQGSQKRCFPTRHLRVNQLISWQALLIAHTFLPDCVTGMRAFTLPARMATGQGQAVCQPGTAAGASAARQSRRNLPGPAAGAAPAAEPEPRSADGNSACSARSSSSAPPERLRTAGVTAVTAVTGLTGVTRVTGLTGLTGVTGLTGGASPTSADAGTSRSCCARRFPASCSPVRLRPCLSLPVAQEVPPLRIPRGYPRDAGSLPCSGCPEIRKRAGMWVCLRARPWGSGGT